MKLLGYDTIRAEVGEYSDAQVRAISLATASESGRKALSPIELAKAVRRRWTPATPPRKRNWAEKSA